MFNFKTTMIMKKINVFSVFAVIFALSVGVFFTSCKDKNGDDPDPNEGKTDPSTIATDNLVAYFPFEDNGVDQIASLTPKTQPNVTYVTGRRGKAYQGVEGAYFLYDLPTASKLRTLKAFTVSMWLNQPQVPNTPTATPAPLLFQIVNTDDLTWGNLTLTLDRMETVDVDSLNIKTVFHKEGATWNNQFLGFSNPAYLASKWIHVIFKYDNITSTYGVVVNGVPLKLSDSTAKRYSGPDDGSGNQPPLGDLIFNKADQFIFGSWIPKIDGGGDSWMGYFLGIMDEVRFYDKALTETEVKALYDAEVTQIN